MQKILEKDGYLWIIFNYRPHLVNAVKNIPGRRWDPTRKAWKVPVSNRRRVEAFASQYGFRFQEDRPGVPERDYTIPPLPELNVDIPLKMKLFPYQAKGVAYALQKKRLIIGDQPGLGKTAQAIATVAASNAFPCLVICPASLKLNWQREWHMWTDRKALLLSNKNKDTWPMFAKSDGNLFQKAAMADVFITNYESLKKFFVARIDKPEGKPLRINHIKFKSTIKIFKSIIIDESHRCKELKTQQTKFVKGICDDKDMILALTGTPVVNKPRDLISQLGIIGQLQNLGGYKNFIDHYCEGYNGAANLKELNYNLSVNCFYRRDKSEVLKDLPAKMRQVVLCDISTKKEYKDALADLEIYLKKYKHATDEQVARSLRGEVMVKIGVLKNISARGKLNDVVEYVNDVMDSGEKLVLFTHLRDVQKNLKAQFPEAVTIWGEDDGPTRQRNVDQFQKNPNVKLIICSIKAAGVGITLTASSRVAFVELPWHPADSEQCEDRCHRIGQKDSVQCTYFLGKNTIDEWIYKIIDEKRSIADTITGAKDKVKESVMDGVINLFAQKI